MRTHSPSRIEGFSDAVFDGRLHYIHERRRGGEQAPVDEHRAPGDDIDDEVESFGFLKREPRLPIGKLWRPRENLTR